MARMSPLAIVGMLVATWAAPAGDRFGTIEAAVNRIVHVTVTDTNGGAVTDLTPADLTVKEGGKEREVVKAEPAQSRMRLALAVEERLLGDGSTRFGMFEFVKRVAKVSDVSLITIGLVNRTIVDYTSNANTILEAINTLTLNPGRDTSVAEGVLEIATKFSAAKAERPVLVVVALSGDQAGVDARTVLEKLGDSGATMHSVVLGIGRTVSSVSSMGDESGREQVLGDGPKQSVVAASISRPPPDFPMRSSRLRATCCRSTRSPTFCPTG